MAPTCVDRYQILEELGKGAMGVVYKALDPTIGRTVALKTMRLDVHGMEAEEMLQRFRAEAHAAGVLNHANIVTIYDAGEHEAHFFIAMEYIEGETLQKRLFRKRTLSVDEVVELTRQICAGLDYAHSHGVIHRDVKPANLMISPEGGVKIMDFGIAKAGGGGLTTAGQVMGSPTYMAPEQVKGMPLDGRSDLFSYGVCLYEMLTGEKPFVGQNVTTIIYKLVHEEPKEPRHIRPEIHPELNAIVMKALAKSPEARFQKGAELVQALKKYEAMAAGAQVTVTAPAVSAPAAKSAAAAAPAAAPTPKPQVSAPAKPPRLAAVPVAKPSPLETVKSLPRSVLIGGVVALLLGVLLGALLLGRHPVVAPPAVEPVAEQPVAQAPAVAAPTEVPTPAAAEPTTEPETTPGEEEPSPATPSKPAPAPAPAPAGAAPSPASTAPAAAAARSGDLHITSTPVGARVQIDGWSEPNWVTPFRSPQLSAGRHTLVFNKPGYAPETRAVEVTGGQTREVRVEFGSAPPPEPSKSGGSPFGKLKGIFGGGIPEGKGMVEVKSEPKGAAVSINGRSAGATPLKVPLDPGSHTVRIVLDGYRPVQRTVAVENGKRIELKETLSK